MNEKQIIQEIVKGNKNAFEMLYNSVSAKVYNTALSYTKDVGDAEEITQDVFVKLHKGAASFKGDSSLETWIYRITVNTSLNYLKKKNRFALFKSTYPNTQTIDFNHPGVLLERKEKAAMLFKVMDSLPDRQKTAFILSYIECLSRKEVAEIMETSLKAVESLLQRAKENLRLKLIKTSPNRRKSQKELSKRIRDE
ncbi:MAG: RNA polymerase sigma factor [Bacteroidia bacterium]